LRLTLSEAEAEIGHACAQFDPVAELRDLAAALSVAYRADPGNALLARELRATLQALITLRPEPEDPAVADLWQEFDT
jgi:hypothetical protein